MAYTVRQLTSPGPGPAGRPTARMVLARTGRAVRAVAGLCAALALAALPAGPALAAGPASVDTAVSVRSADRADSAGRTGVGTAAALAAPAGPSVQLAEKEAGKGGTVTVTGRGWRPKALLTLLICGQNMIGGTNSCANGDGRAVTTDAHGAFRTGIPVAEPPKPCPCVVHVATVTGKAAAADAAFTVAGHPVAPLPEESTGGRLTVLAPPRLEGGSGLLTWFGAPAQRQLTFTVGNLGPEPARDPVFQVGTAHGVFAPKWEDQQWRGTVPAGKKAEIKLPVELAAGAHGDYLVSLKYGGKVLAEQPWGVGRPWGVTLFWVLLCLVVPTAVFRAGMAVVDRLRPRRTAPGRPRTAASATRKRTGKSSGKGPGKRTGKGARRGTGQGARRGGPAAGSGTPDDAAALPWFTPDTAPSTTSTTTSTERPTSKGST
ncbi:hypothetical protein GTY53_22525 [Streptomyces sp. SID7805]|nr:hypothetical protein [Streptomyces sp. SID7805]